MLSFFYLCQDHREFKIEISSLMSLGPLKPYLEWDINEI